MRLVIRNRYGSAAGGLRRYRGSGIFSSIGRKLFSSGLKKVINVATKANLPQKIANIVVIGAQTRIDVNHLIEGSVIFLD